ncbi:poly-beta-1,6 N-acetyl-D-glucosamine export porin PgaA [Nitrospiraceae bacterium HYJII51-Mn-bac16s-1-B09]|uniref:Poly-beta-1,6 N-acetyl-D-glucosamine export porin PgaA n=2 Tax=Candidatus Manganitrophus noduliformans TaxID=2606439 RepID=A0A7X6DQC1_9BACT|nr:poly-beta-1,6 N-acetyl-D-glucosamine export porin PgaA [Candidatus Manganitrophus noduliformans]
MPLLIDLFSRIENTFAPAHRLPSRRWNVAWMMLLCLFGLIGPLEAADSPKVRYEKALQLARDGKHDAALPMLRQLAEEFPKEPFYLYDYMTVLSWAGRDQEVLSLRSRVDLAAAPPYLLETLGRSARNIRDYPLAIRFYEMATKKAPERVEGGLGLARAHLDNGAPQKAIPILQRLDEKHPKRVDILEALAEAYRLDQKNIEALAVYHRILHLDPEHREARRQRILIAAQLGAHDLAASLARENPALLSDEEFERIIGDQAAQSIRFQKADAAIPLLQEQLSRLEGRGQSSSPAYQRARFDLMAALRDRERMEEVIALYETLSAEGIEIPDYALRAAADAYIHEQDPEKARDIYMKILERNPDDFDAKLALFYAYFDTGEYSSALKLIDTVAAEEQDPSRKLRAESVAAMGYAWAGQLSKAQRRFELLLERQPNDPYLHSNLGYVFLWRGWPRRAEEEFHLSQSIEPEVLDAQIGEVGAERDLFEFRAAEEGIIGLETRYPDHRQVERLRRSWNIHNMRELRVAVSGRHNSGTQEGAKDLAVDLLLYSRPLDYNYRVFAHGLYSRSEFPEGDGLYRRYGAGLEYRARDIKVEGELSTGASPDTELGLSLRAAWMPNDFWTWGATLDTYSNDVPLRGRLNEEVKGWSVGLSAGYRFHESRSIGAGVQWLDFSDGNRRISYSLVGYQRLINRPTYKLDGRLGFYGSNNTLENASYYNPSSDLSAEIGLTNEWLVFRRYQRSFLHRLGGTVGTYLQRGFGSNGTWGVFYEHEWNLNDRLYLLYGVGRFRPVYDGVSETSIRWYVTLNWRF